MVPRAVRNNIATDDEILFVIWSSQANHEWGWKMALLDTQNTLTRFFTDVCVHLISLIVVALFQIYFFIRKIISWCLFLSYRFNKARHLYNLRSIKQTSKRCLVFLRCVRSANSSFKTLFSVVLLNLQMAETKCFA